MLAPQAFELLSQKKKNTLEGLIQMAAEVGMHTEFGRQCLTRHNKLVCKYTGCKPHWA